MKAAVDTIQHLLSLGFWGCLALALILAQVALFFRAGINMWKMAFALAWPYVLKPWGIFEALKLSLLSIGLFLISEPARDALQYLECKYIAPVYVSEFEGYPSDVMQAKFESRLRAYVDDYEYRIFTRRIAAIADSIGAPVNALYAVINAETGMNPFIVRKDGRAAGMIQFTPVGLRGLGVSLDAVKAACKDRDADVICDLTQRYLLRAANGRKLATVTDVYLAVFAPGKIGVAPDAVLYSGVGNPAYDLNAGLDGWHVDHAGKIIRSRSAMDGRITAGELYLYCAKKAIY